MLVERLLHLRSGDFYRGLPLFSYYFLIISSAQIGQVARDALFLDQFKAVDLPYADIAISVLVGLVIAFYIRIGQHASLRNLLIGSLCFYAVNLVALWYAVHFYQWPWLYLVLYVWVGVFGVLAPAQVWTLANFVWTTREAKRQFGMLGSGGIAGGIFAGFFSVRMARSFGTESLLIVMVVLLLAAAVVVTIIWRQRQISESQESVVNESGPRNLRESLSLMLQSPLLQAIAALICLSSMVTTIAAWQMKAIAQQTFIGKDALTIFFGQFDGYTGILALLVQLFVTGNLLHRFGIGTALAVLPVSMLFGSATLLIWGTLWAACLVKGSDRVFRYSIDGSAQQLLYLPVPSDIKLQVKSFIDTVVWRFGGGFAGLLILVFARTLGLGPNQIGWLNLVLVVVWLITAFVARRQYVAMLSQSIGQLELDPGEGSVPVLDRAATNVLMAKLKSTDAREILQALNVFEMGQQLQGYSTVRSLLDHSSPEIRAKAISVLNAAAVTSARTQIAGLLEDDSLEVRTQALSYLSRHDHIDPLAKIEELGNFTDFSICCATISFLAKPGETQNLDAARVMLDGMVNEFGEAGVLTRRAAAQLIAELPDHFETQLAKLLDDPDIDVVRYSMRAVAVLRKRRLVPVVIERLTNPALSTDAIEALASFDDAIVGTLRDYLCDPHLSVELRREIPQVLVRIGSPIVARVLAENLLQADSVVRDRIIGALNKLHELHRNIPVDHELIETLMVAEIMGHYHSYQILAAFGGHADDVLTDSMDRERDRIVRLMDLLYPNIDLQTAFRGIQSSDPVSHSNALEFLDVTLSASLRELLLPLVDSEISVEERMVVANRLLPQRVNMNEEAVASLVNSQDPWLRSCAAYAIGKLGLRSFEPELDRLAHDPDPLLRRRIEEAKALLRG